MAIFESSVSYVRFNPASNLASFRFFLNPLQALSTAATTTAMDSVSSWGLTPLSTIDPEIHDLIEREKHRQCTDIELIAHPNSSPNPYLIREWHSEGEGEAQGRPGAQARLLVKDETSLRGILRPARWPSPQGRDRSSHLHGLLLPLRHGRALKPQICLEILSEVKITRKRKEFVLISSHRIPSHQASIAFRISLAFLPPLALASSSSSVDFIGSFAGI